MGILPPQYSAVNEAPLQDYTDPLRFRSMAGFAGGIDSSEGESPDRSPPPRTPECNEKPVKRRASRAGTRSVSTLTPAQLSRKRANDREAQRAIRQRTKEHIEKLELRIAELESCGDNGPNAKFDEVLLRNAMLERQIMQLARQMQSCGPYGYGAQKQYDQSELSPVSQWQSNTFGPASTDTITSCDGMPSGGYINPGMTASSYSPTTMHMPLTPNGNPPFIDTSGGNGLCSMSGTPSDIGSPSDWPGLATGMDQTTTIHGCQPIPRSAPNFPISPVSSPVFRQPALYSWEISSKLVSATSPADSLLLTLIQSQRSMMMNGMPRSQVLGPLHPNFRALIYDDLETQNSTHTISKVVSDILRNTAVLRLPERVACFYILFYLLQWQISPTLETYNNVPEWYQPRASQHVTPHPIWVDCVVWPKLREKIIDCPELYETEEFQEVYLASINLNWQYRDLDVLDVVDEGSLGSREVRVSEQFRRHLVNLNSWSLDGLFQRRYPELVDSCRFTEGGGKDGSNGQRSPGARL